MKEAAACGSMDEISPETARILREVEQQYHSQQMLKPSSCSTSTPNLATMTTGSTVPKVSSKEKYS